MVLHGFSVFGYQSGVTIRQVATPAVCRPWFTRPGVVTVVPVGEAAAWFGCSSTQAFETAVASHTPAALCGERQVEVSALPLTSIGRPD